VLGNVQVEASDEVVALLDDLLYRLWRELATHFHVPTLQWAGPYSRSYSSLLRKYGVLTNLFDHHAMHIAPLAACHSLFRSWPQSQACFPLPLAFRNILSMIQHGSHGAIVFPVSTLPDREERRLPFHCPPDLLPHFTSLPSPRLELSDFVPSTQTVGTTYLHPAFALGR
jgi:hypothetical protein